MKKHIRYVRIEGEARELVGDIAGYRSALTTPKTSFRTSFVARKGYLDGWNGLFLSVLFALYRTGSDIALTRRLRRKRAAA